MDSTPDLQKNLLRVVSIRGEHPNGSCVCKAFFGPRAGGNPRAWEAATKSSSGRGLGFRV